MSLYITTENNIEDAAISTMDIAEWILGIYMLNCMGSISKKNVIPNNMLKKRLNLFFISYLLGGSRKIIIA